MNPAQKIVEYLRSSKAELEKVTWPSKQQTVRYGALVIGVTVILATFFAALDFGFQKSVETLLLRGSRPAVETQPQAPVIPDLTPIDIQTEGDASVNITQ